ncbi:S-transferase Y1 [Plecturocebus cupreus]
MSYEEKKYTLGDAPDCDRSQCLKEKFKLGLEFPNLADLIDGAHKITQSNTILRYIDRKPNLCGRQRRRRFSCLDAFPNLKDFISQFEVLKKISAYMKSSRFIQDYFPTRHKHER